MTEPVTCPDCRGDGERLITRVPGIMTRGTCPDCNGTGRRVVVPVAPKVSRTIREILLAECMKPEEIDGSTEKRHARVRELVAWFARFSDGRANPKWFREHAFELALFAHDMMTAVDALDEKTRR